VLLKEHFTEISGKNTTNILR